MTWRPGIILDEAHELDEDAEMPWATAERIVEAGLVAWQVDYELRGCRGTQPTKQWVTNALVEYLEDHVGINGNCAMVAIMEALFETWCDVQAAKGADALEEE